LSEESYVRCDILLPN